MGVWESVSYFFPKKRRVLPKRREGKKTQTPHQGKGSVEQSPTSSRERQMRLFKTYTKRNGILSTQNPVSCFFICHAEIFSASRLQIKL